MRRYWKKKTDQGMNLKREFLIIVSFLSILWGCAKSPYDISTGKYPPESGRKKQKVFIIARIHHQFGDEFTDEFNRNVLSVWRDTLVLLKKKYSSRPMTIMVSAPVIRRLLSAVESEPEIEDLILENPRDLSAAQVNVLKQQYDVSGSTGSLIYAQVNRAMEYFGDSLKDEQLIRDLSIKSSDYTVKDKQELISFMRENLRSFNELLKSVLDLDNTSEATGTLSNAHLGLLDDERTRVQVLESMINYRMYRERFPDGFYLNGGYLSKDSVAQLNKTNVKWITVKSTTSEDLLRTQPQIINVDEFFYTDLSSSTLTDYIAHDMNRTDGPHVILADIEDLHLILDDRYLESIDYEKLMKYSFDDYDETEYVALSTSTVRSVSPRFSTQIQKVNRLLADARDVVYVYKNSGRAKLDVLIQIQDRLLNAESGDVLRNMNKVIYERFFRKSLIDIYRKINISAPIELFIPIGEPESFEVDETVTSVLKVDCDGRIGRQEWKGSLKVNIEDNMISEKYCGFDDRNIYYMFRFSTSTAYGQLKDAGVILGHMDAGRASLVPRKSEESIENIQDFPILLDVNWRRSVPDKTIIYRTTGEGSWETLTGNYSVGYSSGVLEFTVPFKYIDITPRKKMYYKIYVNGDMFPRENCFTVTVPDFNFKRAMMSFIDSVGDINGPGNYKYPQHLDGFSGALDLRKLEADEKYGEKVISVEFSSLKNPYNAPLGFSPAIVDIYIDVNSTQGLGRSMLLEGRKAYTTPEDAWEYCISVSGWTKGVYNTAGRKIGEPEISISEMNNTLNIFIPKELIPASLENWGIIAAVLASDGRGELIEVEIDNDNPDRFRGRINESDTNIIDVILPPGYRQKHILGANRKNKAIALPALRKRGQ
ncbi:glucodextranase DOMON-like domain-containing protein [Elusimicrobiota bacterium]